MKNNLAFNKQNSELKHLQVQLAVNFTRSWLKPYLRFTKTILAFFQNFTRIFFRMEFILLAYLFTQRGGLLVFAKKRPATRD